MKKGNNKQRKAARGGSRRSKTRDGYIMPKQNYHEPSFANSIAFPPQHDMILKHHGYGTMAGAVTTISKRWQSNNVYQPEVGGATASTPGFTREATIYGFYRGTRYKYKATVANNEAFSVTAFVLNTNGDPGTSASVTLADQVHGQKHILAAKGSGKDMHIFYKELTIADVLGTDEVEYGVDYRAAINAAPTDPLWLTVGATSGTGTNLTNGVWVSMELYQFVRFYDYQPSSNTLKMELLLFRKFLAQKEVDELVLMIKQAKEKATTTPPEITWTPGPRENNQLLQ